MIDKYIFKNYESLKKLCSSDLEQKIINLNEKKIKEAFKYYKYCRMLYVYENDDYLDYEFYFWNGEPNNMSVDDNCSISAEEED